MGARGRKVKGLSRAGAYEHIGTTQPLPSSSTMAYMHSYQRQVCTLWGMGDLTPDYLPRHSSGGIDSLPLQMVFEYVGPPFGTPWSHVGDGTGRLVYWKGFVVGDTAPARGSPKRDRRWNSIAPWVTCPWGIYCAKVSAWPAELVGPT